jgi:hypothetical protein
MEALVMAHRSGLASARLGFAAALGVLSLVLVTGCPDQPEMKCALERSAAATGSLGFAAQYTLVQGSGACSQFPGDVIGVRQFHPNENGRPDFSEGTVGLQAMTMGAAWQGGAQIGAVDPNPDHKVYALGKLASMEPSGGFCTVPTFAPAELDLPEVPPEIPEGGLPEGGDAGDASDDGAVADGAAADGAATDGGAAEDAGACPPPEPPGPFPGQPAQSFRYEWSNLRAKMTKEFPGNVFSADLTITQDGCTASYTVNAVFPAVFCADTPVPAGQPPDPSSPCDDCTNPCSAGRCVAGSCALPGCATAADCPKDAVCADGANFGSTEGVCVAPAAFFCKSTPRPDLGISVPSGIASNVPVACDASLGMCVLTKPVSQL